MDGWVPEWYPSVTYVWMDSAEVWVGERGNVPLCMLQINAYRSSSVFGLLYQGTV